MSDGRRHADRLDLTGEDLDRAAALVKVLALEGAGADARAQVSFSRHGTKWLALSVAKLTPVDD